MQPTELAALGKHPLLLPFLLPVFSHTRCRAGATPFEGGERALSLLPWNYLTQCVARTAARSLYRTPPTRTGRDCGRLLSILGERGVILGAQLHPVYDAQSRFHLPLLVPRSEPNAARAWHGATTSYVLARGQIRVVALLL